MTNQVHGHEVIEMMISSPQLYSKESLKAAIIGKFGGETRFHTCSAENMDAGEMVEYLADHGKFTESPGGFAINPDKICQY
jgi:probable metal-binding protein